MASDPAGQDGTLESPQEFTVSRQNTFEFMPGPLTGISCPCCFKDQLLKEVIRTGECNSCGAGLELTLTATPSE